MLKQRILTALVLLALLIPAVLWLPPTGWAALISVIIGLAAWEWAGLAGYGKMGRIGYGVFVAGLLFGLCIIEWDSEARFLAFFLPCFWFCFAFWFVAVPLWLRFRWPLKGIPGLCVGLIVLLPAGFMAAIADSQPANALLYGNYGKTTLLLILMIAWVADTCAYFTGRKFGKHKLAPGISPGKTWEGVAGAVAGVFLYLASFFLILAHQNEQPDFTMFAILLAVAFALALVLTAVSVIGDLFESLLKRQAGVKDSSPLLPGHGGILDRIDSLLALLPVVGALTGALFLVFIWVWASAHRLSIIITPS